MRTQKLLIGGFSLLRYGTTHMTCRNRYCWAFLGDGYCVVSTASAKGGWAFHPAVTEVQENKRLLNLGDEIIMSFA